MSQQQDNTSEINAHEDAQGIMCGKSGMGRGALVALVGAIVLGMGIYGKAQAKAKKPADENGTTSDDKQKFDAFLKKNDGWFIGSGAVIIAIGVVMAMAPNREACKGAAADAASAM